MQRTHRFTDRIDRIATALIVVGLILVAVPAGLWLNAKYFQWRQDSMWRHRIGVQSSNHGNASQDGPGESKTPDQARGENAAGKSERADQEVIPGWSSELVDRTPVAPGESIAYLEIPRIDRGFGVIESETWANLAKGPVHVSKTARVGDKGTVLISGHRTMYGAPFHNLHRVQLEDTIFLYTERAMFTYTVIGIKKVRPDDWTDIRPEGEPRLVLSTCEPMYSAEKRLLVIARLTESRKLQSTGRDDRAAGHKR